MRRGEAAFIVVVLAIGLLAGRALWRGASSDDDGSSARAGVVDWQPRFDASNLAPDPCTLLRPDPDPAPAPLWPGTGGDVVLQYTLDDAKGDVVRVVSLDDLGRLVVVARDGPVSADELRTTLLTPEGADRLLALVTGAMDSAPHDAPADPGEDGTYGATVVLEDGRVASALVDAEPAPAPPPSSAAEEVTFADALGVLADLGWLTDDPAVVVEPEAPWAPDLAQVTMRRWSGDGPPTPVTWPVVPRLELERSQARVHGGVEVAAVLGLFGSDEPPVVEVEGTLLVLELDIDLPGEPPIEGPSTVEC